jgi:peptidoglycan/LPS O-acetylase OafA/YrhL
VQVFLVIAGFLAAASLAPDGTLRVERPVARILQRYGRLVMPYLAALTVCVLVAAVVRPWLDEEVVPASPTLGQLVAHGLLLQDLLGYESLSTGVWYVAIDFQLFALALVLVGLPTCCSVPNGATPGTARALAAGGAGARAGRGLAGALQPQRGAGRHGLLLLRHLRPRHAGVLDRPRHARQHLAERPRAAGAGGCGRAGHRLAQPHRDGAGHGAAAGRRAAPAVAVARALAAAAVPLQRLGRMSYSLFLIHFPVLLAMNAAVANAGPHGAWFDAAGLVATFALSVGAAALLYRWVERARRRGARCSRCSPPCWSAA